MYLLNNICISPDSAVCGFSKPLLLTSGLGQAKYNDNKMI